MWTFQYLKRHLCAYWKVYIYKINISAWKVKYKIEVSFLALTEIQMFYVLRNITWCRYVPTTPTLIRTWQIQTQMIIRWWKGWSNCGKRLPKLGMCKAFESSCILAPSVHQQMTASYDRYSFTVTRLHQHSVFRAHAFLQLKTCITINTSKSSTKT